MNYETLSRIAQQGGLIYFTVLFIAGAAYALWPKNRETFRCAARLPLDDEEL